jgi:cyclophilin family peptidyl-prolyl cis-trans isomerase/HEAT repeat protein
VPDADPGDRLTAEYLRILDLEDMRPTEGPPLDRLVQHSSTENVFLRAVAIRALGRLENPALVTHIEKGLHDPSANVRLEAAYALAQAHFTSDGDQVFEILADGLSEETNATVRGELARSLGRLRLTSEHRSEALRLLLDATRDGSEDAPLEVLTGALLGIESLVRTAPASTNFGPRLAVRAGELTGYLGAHRLAVESVRVRTLSFTILGLIGAVDAERLQRSLRDDAPLVPATAMKFFDQITSLAQPETMRRAVGNSSLHSVLEAFRILGSTPRTGVSCSYLLAAARVTPEDSTQPVPEPIRLLGVAGLDEPCTEVELQRTILREVEATLDTDPMGWQDASYALLSLAQVFPGDAAARLSRHIGHENPFVRTYAARAATVLGNRSVLRTLAYDDADNVRTVAIQGLYQLDGHRIDDVLVAQLERDDPQLLMTAARLLDGASRTNATAVALLTAFERISAAQRETWRDPRVALVETLTQLGDRSLSDRMIPFLSDYDARIAGLTAAALREWNGRPYTPTPHPLPRMPLPSVQEMKAMDGAHVVLHMQSGGQIDIELHPYLSTTNTFRFWRLVQEGHFDGLTFHRWAPNFVLQGGSPGANEYQGDGPFTRDEVGTQAQWRGTVGISTRGHDTGDGQIYFNLMDNVRLDHAYTIIGTVVSGMDVVDVALEGAVIERAEAIPAR